MVGVARGRYLAARPVPTPTPPTQPETVCTTRSGNIIRFRAVICRSNVAYIPVIEVQVQNWRFYFSYIPGSLLHTSTRYATTRVHLTSIRTAVYTGTCLTSLPAVVCTSARLSTMMRRRLPGVPSYHDTRLCLATTLQQQSRDLPIISSSHRHQSAWRRVETSTFKQKLCPLAQAETEPASCTKKKVGRIKSKQASGLPRGHLAQEGSRRYPERDGAEHAP